MRGVRYGPGVRQSHSRKNAPGRPPAAAPAPAQADRPREGRLAARLSATTDPAELLALGVAVPAAALHVPVAALLVRDPASGLLVVREGVGLPAGLRGHRLPLDLLPPPAPVPPAFRERRGPGRPRFFDPDNGPEFDGFRPLLAVPLERGGP